MTPSKGRLAIVGVGQGGARLTIEAVEAIKASTDIVGYRSYFRGLAELITDQSLHKFAMGEELVRARTAMSLADRGHRVVLISSGDAGVYGMAGPVIELLGADSGNFEIQIIPGISAALACAAAVGAPLMNDFAVISLSDILTPWDQIERRLNALAGADMVIALYNPASSKRKKQIGAARSILLEYRDGSTLVAIVKDAGSAPQAALTDLENMPLDDIDMRTTVIIGNSQTVRQGDMLVTARGYRV